MIFDEYVTVTLEYVFICVTLCGLFPDKWVAVQSHVNIYDKHMQAQSQWPPLPTWIYFNAGMDT